MNMDDITVNFSHIGQDILLAEWSWLIGNKKPILVTAMGDAFVQDPNDFSVHFLNVIDGKIEEVAASSEQLKACLNDRGFVGKYFHVQAVGELIRAGRTLKKKTIYSLIHPIWLGGSFESTNIEVIDIHVHFSVAGQTFQQVCALPSGTTISGFIFEPQIKPNRWWKFWS